MDLPRPVLFNVSRIFVQRFLCFCFNISLFTEEIACYILVGSPCVLICKWKFYAVVPEIVLTDWCTYLNFGVILIIFEVLWGDYDFIRTGGPFIRFSLLYALWRNYCFLGFEFIYTYPIINTGFWSFSVLCNFLYCRIRLIASFRVLNWKK